MSSKVRDEISYQFPNKKYFSSYFFKINGAAVKAAPLILMKYDTISTTCKIEMIFLN